MLWSSTLYQSMHRGHKKTGVNYEGDIERILKAYETIPNEQRFVLLNPLRSTFFVRSIDLGTGKRYWSSPEQGIFAYRATQGIVGWCAKCVYGR